MKTGLLLFLLSFLAISSGCASKPTLPTSRESYARLSDKRVYDADLPTVWKATERVMSRYKITDRDSEGSQKRSLETDWVYGQSRDKYQPVRVNGTIKDIPLGTRLRYKMLESRILGGTQVQVQTTEELEQLKADGSSAGYHRVSDSEKDSSRANEILDQIGLALISS